MKSPKTDPNSSCGKNGMKVSLVNEFGKVSLDNIYTEALDKPLALGYLKSGFFYPKRVFN